MLQGARQIASTFYYLTLIRLPCPDQGRSGLMGPTGQTSNIAEHGLSSLHFMGYDPCKVPVFVESRHVHGQLSDLQAVRSNRQTLL